VADLAGMLELGRPQAWRPPIVRTVATTGEGIEALWGAIVAHREHLSTDGRLDARRTERARQELRAIVTERLRARADALCDGAAFDDLVEQVVRRERDPYDAADAILG
jgi:LAO/AO transport system kinase